MNSSGQPLPPAPPAPPAPGSKPAPPPPPGSLLYGNSSNVYDPCGHGTHVAGIIAGNANRSQAGYGGAHTFLGIAPQANLISIRVLDQYGSSDVGTVLAGLQYVQTYNSSPKGKASPIRVVNLSLGHPVGESYTTDPICQAVETLYKAGVVVVCAAGNEGRVNGGVNTAGLDNEGWGTNYGSIQSPANDPYVITVGATKSLDGLRADDKIATYSSRGPSRLDLMMKPDIVAPGNKVISLDAQGSTLDLFSGGVNQVPYSYYLTASEQTAFASTARPPTTFSCRELRWLARGRRSGRPAFASKPDSYPRHNQGAFDAVRRQVVRRRRHRRPADLRRRLPQHSRGSGFHRRRFGSRRKPRAARQQRRQRDDRPEPGAVGLQLMGTGVTDLRAIWGTRALWGTSSIDSSRAMWGTNTTFAADRAMWGTSTVTAERAMWGSSVWGDRAMWGSSSTAVDLNSAALTGE